MKASVIVIAKITARGNVVNFFILFVAPFLFSVDIIGG